MGKKEQAALRLLEMNVMIRNLADSMEDAAAVAKESDASGVAFACQMLRESLLSYAKAVTDYARDVLE